MIFFALANHPEGQSRDELKFFLYGRRLADNDSVSILLSRMKVKLKPKGYLIRNVGPHGLSCYQMRKVMVNEKEVRPG